MSGNTEQVKNILLRLFFLFSISGTGGSSDTIADYFSQLTQSEVKIFNRAQDHIDDVNANPKIQVGALFRKYQLDFELYGYDPEPYFDIAIVEPDAPVELDTEANP